MLFLKEMSMKFLNSLDSRESISKEEVYQRSLGKGNRNEKIYQDSYKIPSWRIGSNEIPNREVIIPKEGHIFPREGSPASVRMINFLGQ